MRKGLFYCRISDAIVILDLVANRYRLVKREGVARFLRMVEDEASPEDIAWLAQHDINGQAHNVDAEFVPPSASAWEQSSGAGNLILTIAAAWHQLAYQRRLGKCPLYALLEKLDDGRPSRQGSDDEAMTIASAFAHSKRYISAQDKCLSRALAMLHMLFGSGTHAQLIFGVTMPFAAHCWIQQGDVVLSDPLDRVLPFQPILIL